MLGYLVDSSGVITEFLGDFRGVAARNGGDTDPEQWLGQPLFSFVQGYELKQVISNLLKRPDRQKKVRLHRCDAPERLRLWQLSVESTGKATRVLFEQVAQRDRPFQPKLEPFPNPVAYCSWCNAVMEPSGAFNWLNVTDSYRLASMIRREPESVEHLLCPACFSSLQNPERAGAFSHLTRAFTGRAERNLRPPSNDRVRSRFT
ncbi:hypothetical protein JST97_38190 [bacterium]|nr:hypothetical protein [bacterium]